MKRNTLYISDLDGTLLNAQAELSEYAAKSLNHFIQNGVNFSIATARTGASALKLLSQVALNQPLILMNGVLIYDMEEERFVKREVLSFQARIKITEVMQKTGQAGLMYGLVGDKMTTYYQHLEIKPLRDFVEERMQKFNKKFIKTDDFNNVDADIIYFCFLNTKKNIDILHSELKKINEINFELYQDIYSPDLWYLEISKSGVSKYSGIMFLREKYGFEKIIGFGDNLNDIPLFKACDEAYAVSNAKPEVKSMATAVIGTNHEDGVIKWLEANV